MKVTKRVQEYVQKRVAEKYANLVHEPKRVYDESREAHKQFVEVVIREANAKILSAYPDWYPNGTCKAVGESYSSTGMVNPFAKPYKEAVAKADRLTNKSVDEILIEMELGGTRESLERMLDELCPEENDNVSAE